MTDHEVLTSARKKVDWRLPHVPPPGWHWFQAVALLLHLHRENLSRIWRRSWKKNYGNVWGWPTQYVKWCKVYRMCVERYVLFYWRISASRQWENYRANEKGADHPRSLYSSFKPYSQIFFDKIGALHRNTGFVSMERTDTEYSTDHGISSQVTSVTFACVERNKSETTMWWTSNVQNTTYGWVKAWILLLPVRDGRKLGGSPNSVRCMRWQTVTLYTPWLMTSHVNVHRW